MIADSLKTLFYPFDSAALDTPKKGERILFFGAEPGFRLPDGFAASLHCVQGFRPSFLKLAAAGHDVSPEPEGSEFDAALILAGRHRGLNERWVREAWDRIKVGGVVLVAGGKQDGVDSLRKRIAEQIRLSDSLSKFHGVVFWFRKTAGTDCPLPETPPVGLIEGRFAAASGMFSADHVDPASKLLAESLPDDIKGAVADFGAGWGFLASVLANRVNAPSTLDLYEADHASLEAARVNLAGTAPHAPARFFWQDLVAEPVAHRYDFIAMNPPFHAGRAAEPSIGTAMIAAASKALKPRGRLFLVANRGLPYERALSSGFGKSGEIGRDKSFKVLWGQK